MSEGNSVGFIGAGNMGGAIIRGLLSSGIRKSSSLVVADPRKDLLNGLADEFPGIQITQDNRKAAGASIVILALKPNMYEQVIQGIRNVIVPETLIVSIAAGIRLSSVEEWFQGHRKIIRTMPNTPAMVSEGMSALCPSEGVDDNELAKVRTLFESVGRTITIPEKMMDAYTALAGSGPALVFMFMEALADAAVREGIPREMAYDVASQVLAGSAKLARVSGKHPGELKDQVCSPAGTTIEAVAVLEAKGFRSAVIEAINRCTAKAGELGRKVRTEPTATLK